MGDGEAHELEGRAAVRESVRVGPAAVQRGADRGDEDRVIGQPAVDVGHALDGQATPDQGVCEGCET